MKDTIAMQLAISKDGTAISYQKKGAGQPLLIVHGASADHRSWINVSQLLEKHYAVHLMDRRGRGQSGDAPDYSLMREAEDIAAVVDAIDEPVTLFGHSFGGLCCLEAALLTDNINHLILYEPPVPTGKPTIPEGVIDRMQALIDDGELEAAMELTLREVAEISESDLEAYRQSPLWKARIPLTPTIPREISIENTYRFDAQRFTGLHVLTTLLLGSESPEQYRQAIGILDDALPNSRVIILPGQQHLAHHSNPELLADKIKAILEQE